MKRPALLLAAAFAALPLAAETDGGLSVSQAMALSARQHVDVKIAAARSDEARGKALQDASALLPQIMGTASQSRVFKVNLAAEGLGDFPGIDPLLGPFNVFDARARLAQTLIDVEALQKARSSAHGARSARLQENLAREQASAAAALSYLEALRAQEAVAAARSGADLARQLLGESQDRRKAGAAAGIDVARARTRAAEEDLRLLQARSDAQDALTRLKRLLGMPLGQPLALSDPFRFSEETAPGTDEALRAAAKGRLEVRIAEEKEKEEALSLSSDKWAHAPSLSAAGDYGWSGNDPGNAHGTGSVGLQLSLPLFTSGRLAGRAEEARGRWEEARARLEDVRSQVEEDVRLALDKLATSAARVKASQEAVRLAESELTMAQDQLAAGAGENIEAVGAEASLARVRDASIAALADYQAARINLAMALGDVSAFKL